jgi:hypothetical protein
MVAALNHNGQRITVMNISFDIKDAADAAAAIKVLAYVAAGFDAAFPAIAILAALPGETTSQGSKGDTAD